MSAPTFTEEYRTRLADRARWGDGPWADEPDKAVWVDEATGMPCMLVRNGVGALCGYVGVSAEHPWFGKGYSQCTAEACDRAEDDWYCDHTPEHLIDAHGGLTFADACHEDAPDHREAICHLADDGQPVWWFGFDCAHSGDLAPSLRSHGFRGSSADTYKPVAYVAAECASIAHQLAEVAR